MFKNDIVPELLAKIQTDFEESIKKDAVLTGILEKIQKRTASYADANVFSVIAGQILSEVYKRHLLVAEFPDGRLYYNIAKRIMNSTLKQNHALIAKTAADVQTILNRSANLGLVGIQAKVNQSRIDGLITRIANAEDLEKITWLFEEPIVNFSQSIIDDTVKANADFHAKAGLRPKIHRREAGNCCDWCREVVGVYEYPNVPKDVFRRHRFCRCTVDYHPGDGRRQNTHTKRWVDPEEKARIEERKQIGLDILERVTNRR